MTNRKHRYRYLILLLACFTVAYLLFKTLNSEKSFFDVPAAHFNTAFPVQTGAMHGVRLSIPSNYLYFPIEYDGEESWRFDGRQAKYNQDSEIRAFSIYVQWPDMKPRTTENEASYQQSFKGNREHNWLMIGVQRESKKKSPGERAILETNGLGRLLAGELSNFDLNLPWRDKDIPTDVHFAIKSDQALQLTVATPVGTGTENRAIWNNELFWDGPSNKIINTFIECRNRTTIKTNHTGSCTHKFEIQELHAIASITYKSKYLGQWKDIEDKAHRLIVSFAAQDKSHVDNIR